MKKNILFAIGMTALACSCNDFLDREPMDAVPVEKYLLSENDLAAYTANLYNSLPSHKPGVTTSVSSQPITTVTTRQLPTRKSCL